MTGPLTVSIIDDDESIRIAIKDLVTALGFVAYDFESAESFLNSPQYDTSSCVISDIQMPGMTGSELQRHLLMKGRPIPMIFITAFPDKNIHASLLEAGALAFLEKPFDCNQLISALSLALTPDGSVSQD